MSTINGSDAPSSVRPYQCEHCGSNHFSQHCHVAIRESVRLLLENDFKRKHRAAQEAQERYAAQRENYMRTVKLFSKPSITTQDTQGE